MTGTPRVGRTTARRPAAVTALAAVVALAALSGCGALGGAASDGDDAVRDDVGAVESAGDVEAVDLTVGDCFQDEPAGGSPARPTGSLSQVESLRAVPCGEPHDNEVVAELDLPDGEYPGEEEVQLLAEQRCTVEVDEFLDVDSALASSLVASWLAPTSGSWASGDRQVTCLVLDPAGPLTGSVAGRGAEFPADLPVAGDCLDEDTRPVDCMVPHASEIVIVSDLTGAGLTGAGQTGEVYPGDEAVDVEARRLCAEAFAGYVGLPIEASALDVGYLGPDEQTWDQGDRLLVCAAFDPAGPLTGSVIGSGR